MMTAVVDSQDIHLGIRVVPRRRFVHLALCTLVIVAIVVPWRSLQTHPHWLRIRWVPFVSAPVGLGDIIGNVLLYVPFGYFAGSYFGRRGWLMGLVGATVLSCTTEFTQIWSHGRFPSLQDVLMNVSGAAVGMALPYASRRK
jgi:glycopeptide antibiotics resistance protein